jgi:hypothetical protein
MNNRRATFLYLAECRVEKTAALSELRHRYYCQIILQRKYGNQPDNH